MKWLLGIALALVCAGGGLVWHARTLPVYTDSDAPQRLSLELQHLPRDKRFEAWYQRLGSYETGHKRSADLGRGLCAAGIGLAVAAAFLMAFQRHPRMRAIWVLMAVWIALWALRVPLSFRYYTIRLQRFDFPTWGDTIAIPIFSEMFAWIIGATVTSLILRVMIKGRELTPRLAFVRPQGVWGWCRVGILALWLALNALCVKEGIPDGDEGMTLACVVASAVLLSAKEKPPAEGQTPTTEA